MSVYSLVGSFLSQSDLNMDPNAELGPALQY